MKFFVDRKTNILTLFRMGLFRAAQERWEGAKRLLCIMANENILASENLCFRVFKLWLKVINKNFVICTVYELIKLIKFTLLLVALYLFKNF